MKTIGQRIKEARELRGITQEELGKACGTTKQTIFKYESGIVTNIPMDRLSSIAKHLHISPAVLMGWADPYTGAGSLGKRIEDRREALKMSVDALAERTGINRATIYRYENGELENMTIDHLEPLAKALQTTPSSLLGWDDPSDPVNAYAAFGQLHPVKHVSFPIIGSVSCGEPKFAESDYAGTVYADEDVDADFCLRAKGDSMINAGIEDGNIVFIKRQQTVQNGEIAVVAIGDEALLKRVYWYPDKQLLILRPENPAYEDLLYTAEAAEEIRILGKAVFLQKRIR